MRGKLENPPPRDPFQYILNLEASLHSLLSFAWTLTRPTNYLRQNIVFSYPEMIRVSFSLFLSLSVFCYFTLLLIFIKIILLLLLFYLFIFMKIIFIFSCSGMFRHVPECSVFRVLSTPQTTCNTKTSILTVALLNKVDNRLFLHRNRFLSQATRCVPQCKNQNHFCHSDYQQHNFCDSQT